MDTAETRNRHTPQTQHVLNHTLHPSPRTGSSCFSPDFRGLHLHPPNCPNLKPGGNPKLLSHDHIQTAVISWGLPLACSLPTLHLHCFISDSLLTDPLHISPFLLLMVIEPQLSKANEELCGIMFTKRIRVTSPKLVSISCT